MDFVSSMSPLTMLRNAVYGGDCLHKCFQILAVYILEHSSCSTPLCMKASPIHAEKASLLIMTMTSSIKLKVLL